jgi:hypothetical protein
MFNLKNETLKIVVSLNFLNNKNSKRMKKMLVFSALMSLVLLGCTKKENGVEEQEVTIAQPQQRICAAQDVLEEQMATDPTLRQKMNDLELFTQRYVSGDVNASLSTDTIRIPVVFNVLYRTAAENVSDAQLKSQIDVLNQDFQGYNSDVKNIPAIFSSVKAGFIPVKFVLSSVVRKSTTLTSWTSNDNMKSSAKGGISPTTPTTKLNIWVCTLGGGLLGYAQFPGGRTATDGVVLLNTATGKVGTARAPYGLGRTATHEVGHWLNLRHIWGDANCGTDNVGDTPQHNASNSGCPSYPHYSTCNGKPIEMTMNYMDYTNDACMYMFSAGQKARMLALFVTGGLRSTIGK